MITTGITVTKNRISDEELFYHVSSCPFFSTPRDGELEDPEGVLLPLFRYFHYRGMTKTHKSFSNYVGILNKYLISGVEKGMNFQEGYSEKLTRYFTNFYSLFHPRKRFVIILPFFPYRYRYLMGCTEVIVKTTSGIRIYAYNFADRKPTDRDLNYYGFKLQLAARVFHLKTGIDVTSMGMIMPANRVSIYYAYNPNEKLEEHLETIKDNPSLFIRRYGDHCYECIHHDCRPIIDDDDKLGWGLMNSKFKHKRPM